MSNTADILAGTAVVDIVANDASLKKALEKSKGTLDGFAQVCMQVGMRLKAAGDLLIAPFARAG